MYVYIFIFIFKVESHGFSSFSSFFFLSPSSSFFTSRIQANQGINRFDLSILRYTLPYPTLPYHYHYNYSARGFSLVFTFLKERSRKMEGEWEKGGQGFASHLIVLGFERM